MKPKPAQKHWQRVANHGFGQLLVGSYPPDFRNLLVHRCTKPHHRDKVDDHGGSTGLTIRVKIVSYAYRLATIYPLQTEGRTKDDNRSISLTVT